jgi:hypothetical protein
MGEWKERLTRRKGNNKIKGKNRKYGLESQVQMKEAAEGIFKQRQGFTRLKYRILETGVEFQEKALFQSASHRVAFEEIPDEPQEVKISSKYSFWVMIVFLAIVVFFCLALIAEEDIAPSSLILYGILALISTVFYFLSRQKWIVYKAGPNTNSLVLLKNKPNKASFEEFVNIVQSRKHEYLKKTYLTGPVESNSADAIQKLVALKELGALTEDEFSKLKAEVVRKAEFMGGSAPSAN